MKKLFYALIFLSLLLPAFAVSVHAESDDISIYEEAVVIQAKRGLTAPQSEYEQAAVIQAMRWQAMAQFYADHGLLNTSFDYEEAAVIQAVRWLAMAKFYEDNGLLNVDSAAFVEGTYSH